MNKARKCDWCGETIEGDADRVKLPVMYEGPAMTYHVNCYVKVYHKDVQAVIDTSDHPELVQFRAERREAMLAKEPEKTTATDPGATSVGWFDFRPQQERMVITLDVPIDDVAEAVMARIAARMVAK